MRACLLRRNCTFRLNDTFKYLVFLLGVAFNALIMYWQFFYYFIAKSGFEYF